MSQLDNVKNWTKRSTIRTNGQLGGVLLKIKKLEKQLDQSIVIFEALAMTKLKN